MEKVKEVGALVFIAAMNATGVWMLLLRLMGEQIEQIDRAMGGALFGCLVLLFLLLFSHKKNRNCDGLVLEQQG